MDRSNMNLSGCSYKCNAQVTRCSLLTAPSSYPAPSGSEGIRQWRQWQVPSNTSDRRPRHTATKCHSQSSTFPGNALTTRGRAVAAAAVQGSEGGGANAAPPSTSTSQQLQVQTTIELEIPNKCHLSVSCTMNEQQALSLALLAAFHQHYETRARQFASNVGSLIASKPTLQTVLKKTVPDALQASPKKSMQNLDDFQSMLALCKVVNPAVADRIEQEMVIEIERIRSSTDQSSNESGKEALGVLEGSLRVEQASKGFEVARKLARGAKWEQWKQYMRNAIVAYDNPNGQQEEMPSDDSFLSLLCNALTASGKPLVIALSITATGGNIGRVKQFGHDSSPAARAYLAALQLSDPPMPTEPQILPFLEGRCWDVLAELQVDTFACTISTELDPATSSTSTSAQLNPPPSAAVEFSGSGFDLASIIAALSVLESGELGVGRQGRSPWYPSDGRISFQRANASRGRTVYGLRVSGEDGAHGHDGGKDENVAVALSSDQTWALIDCLDSLSQAMPTVFPHRSLPPLPPVPFWKRAVTLLGGN